MNNARFGRRVYLQCKRASGSSYLLNANVSPRLDSTVRQQSTKTSGPQGTRTLVLVRHGESTWNQENLFTGWYDCPLSDKGHKEAAAAGVLLKQEGLVFDVAFTSKLKRAIRTLWHSLEQTNQMSIPIVNAWQLNERHYGALQGLDKQATVDKYGKDQVNVWRRSYDVPPPPCDLESEHYPKNDAKFAAIPQAAVIRTESLKVCRLIALPVSFRSLYTHSFPITFSCHRDAVVDYYRRLHWREFCHTGILILHP